MEKYNFDTFAHFWNTKVKTLVIVKKISKKIPQKYIARFSGEALPLIVGSVLVGLISVLYEELFKHVEGWSINLFNYSPYYFFILSPLCFFLTQYIVTKYSKYASGSGIPQLLAAIEISETSFGNKVMHKLLGIKIILFKILSSLILLFGGGSIGREGPTLHISGSIFKIISDFMPKTRAKITQQTLLITGGASGLAAAFNTPLGGIVYVVEELTKAHINKLRTPIFSAVIIAGFTAQFFTGSYLFLGFPKIKSLPLNLIPMAILVSVLGGLMAGVFCKVVLAIIAYKKTIKNKNLFAIGLGLAFATLLFFTDSYSIGSGKPLINKILFDKTEALSYYSFPARFFGSILSFVTGGAGGIFATSLASGAALGQFVLSFFEFAEVHQNLLILMTMIAFLTGVTRTPFTSAVLVLEMTDRHSAIFYFLMAGIIAQYLSEYIQKKPIYEVIKDDIMEDLKTKPRNQDPA